MLLLKNSLLTGGYSGFSSGGNSGSSFGGNSGGNKIKCFIKMYLLTISFKQAVTAHQDSAVETLAEEEE